MSKTKSDIMEEYLKIIYDHFGHLYEYCKKKHIDSNDLKSVGKLTSQVYDQNSFETTRFLLRDDLIKFWDKNYESFKSGIAKYKGVVSFYNSPTGAYNPPQGIKKYIKKVGLYSDSIVITDPIIELTKIKHVKSEWVCSLIISRCFELFDCDELFFSETKQPILALIPKESEIIKEKNSALSSLNDKTTLHSISKIFNNNFESYQKLEQYFKDNQRILKKDSKQDWCYCNS